MSPGDLAITIRSYVSAGKANQEIVKALTDGFSLKWELMKAVDISDFLYCMAQLEFQGAGDTFWRRVHKATSKLIANFNGAQLA